MKCCQFAICLAGAVLLAGCVSSRKLGRKASEVAQSYIGVRYKYGGNTADGIDCSGLISKSLGAVGVAAPRKASLQAEAFMSVKPQKVRPGDLVFFVTSGNYINHTGMVIKKARKGSVAFVHASTSQGVRVDELYSNYWLSKFVKAVRPSYKTHRNETK